MADYVRTILQEERVLGLLLEKRAAEQADDVFVVLEDGSTVTYAEMLAAPKLIGSFTQGR